MLLTRAPLNKSRIATQLAPCDLHVLNTPPAFVLSQNQTLRKNDFCKTLPLPCRNFRAFSNRVVSPPRGETNFFCAPFPGAQRTIQSSFSTRNGTGLLIKNDALSAPPAHPSHTVKEPVLRGLKSRPGENHRDRLSVSRPPCFVAARKASSPAPTASTFFRNFFHFFPPTHTTR